MKKAAIAGIVIGALAIGGIGGNLVVSQMLENRIRDSINKSAAGIEAQCDDVRVSLLQRTISISNLRLNGSAGEQRYRELILRPTFSLMLAGSIPSLQFLLPTSGPLALGDAAARDITLGLAPSGEAATDEITLKTLTVSDACLDASLFAELLQSRSAPALSDFVEKAGTGRIEISQLRLRSAMSPLISVESLTLEDIVAGSRIALVEARQFMIADQYINGSLRLTDIAIPPNLARKMLDQTISAEDIKQTLLTANQPLYRTMTLENGTFVYGDTKIACRRLSLDWRSNNPLHTTSRVEQLDIPIDSASGLQQLRIDSEGEHVQRGNLSHDKGSIDIAGAGRLEFDLEYNVDFAGSSLEDDNLQSLLDTQLDKIRLRYEDKGGMALLLAVSIDNRESISQTVDMLEAQIPAALPGEDNRQLVEALRTTLLTPGTLELRLRDGMKMRMADILNTAALGRMLQASAVPGKENVKDQLLRILKQ